MSFANSFQAPAACFALAVLAAAPSCAAPAPAPSVLPSSADLVYRTTATMKLMGLPVTLHARTTTRWRLDGGRYEMHLHMDTADFDQISRGRLGPDGDLVPDRYEEKRPFHEPDAVDVDWAHGDVRFGGAPPAPAPEAGAQDRLSLQFQLGQLRQHYPEQFVSGSVHTVKLIGTHDVDLWHFTVGQEDAIETGRGSMRAVRFSAHRTVGSVEETMDIWLGAELRWMPVRIRIVDRKGSVIDSVLQDADLP